ncbi:MAG: nuclear transport factor 2 family protein [Burkholderiaceae bacterium]
MLARIAMVCLLFVTCTTNAIAGPKEDALAAYHRFFELFITDNHDQIALLFAPDALFFGTGSTDVVTTREGVRQYFVPALSGKRGTTKATPFEQTALVLSDTIVAISGKWQSERTLDGKMSTAGPSRNTVVLQKRGDQWLIVQFHNSPTPKPPAAPEANR